MQEHDNLKNTDPDLKLARSFGEDLEKGTDASARDPLVSRLIKARDSRKPDDQNLLDDSRAKVWTKVEHETIVGPKNIRPVSISRAWYWAAAALVLIFFGSLFLMQQGDELPAGLLSEQSNQVQTITLEDGSSVTLRPFASLYREYGGSESHIYRIEGEALFDVASNPDRLFEVLTGSGRITVTGTRFKASDRDGAPSVYLLSGSVNFTSSSSGETASLRPGMSAQLDSAGTSIKISSFEPEAITSWTNNIIRFDNRAAGWVVAEISYHFNIDVLLPGDAGDKILGGTIRLENPGQSLYELGLVLGGTFDRQETGSYIFRQD